MGLLFCSSLPPRFDCLGRTILVTKKELPQDVGEGTDGGRKEENLGGAVVPGILKSYEPSTELFRIRFSDGHK